MTRHYMPGFGNDFETESLAGALPQGQNSPQRCAYGLYAEQLSGSPFTAPRGINERSWLYRIRPSVKHSGRFAPVERDHWKTAPNLDDHQLPIGQLRWNPTPMPRDGVNFLDGIRTMTTAGDVHGQAGMAAHVYAFNRDMEDDYFFDADGEMLLVPEQGRLHIFTETGKNGGDGFVVAMLAMKAGLQVDVYLTGDRSDIQGDALKAFTDALNSNIPIYQASPFPDLKKEQIDTVIVDALLGTGLSGKVKEPYRELIECINKSGLPVVSVDIPSGICGDTGEELGASVKANLTVTFIGRKRGLIEGKGRTRSGKVVFDDLGIPSDVYSQVSAEKEV